MLEYLRSWIVADDVTIPAIAFSNNIQITDNKIRLTFVNGGAELYAIACGKKYQVEQQQKVYVTADITFRSESAKIKGNNQYYEISAQDENSEAIAFYRNGSNPPVAVKLVSQITGSNQIVIGAGGEARASTNLIGKTIKILRLPAIYSEAVIISNEEICEYRIFLLVRTEEKIVQLYEYNDCMLQRKSERIDAKNRTLEFSYSLENRVCRKI